MQYVCIKIQPRPLLKTLDDSGGSIDSQPLGDERHTLPSSPKLPDLNKIQSIQKLPTDYSKLASTVGTFNKPKTLLKPSAAVPAPPTTVVTETPL